jgi:hypothetical protein
MKPALFEDEYYLMCISLATLSKSGGERYGSILVKDGMIIGKGFNRAIAHRYIRLERKIKMGYANHAEIEAMNNAMDNGFDISGADLYCAGYFPLPHTGFSLPNRLHIKDGAVYTCVKCPPHMEKYGIARIVVPTPIGWSEMSMEAAARCAIDFKYSPHEKRISAVPTTYTLEDLAGSLIREENLFSC